MITWMNVNTFQVVKVQPQCQFQPGVAYKSVAYKKSACLTEIIWKTYEMFVRTLFSIEYRTYVPQTDISQH